MSALNRFQKAVLRTYGDGDLAHTAEGTLAEAETWIEGQGDLLPLFLIRELNDVDDSDDAQRRMEAVVNDAIRAQSAVQEALP